MYARKKPSLAQEVRQKSDISEHRSIRTLFVTRPLGHWATRQGSSYTKNEYNLFYRKFDAEYFFIQQFFRKKKNGIFRENREKLFCGRI